MDKHSSATAIQPRPLPVPNMATCDTVVQDNTPESRVPDTNSAGNSPAVSEPSSLLVDSVLICGVIGLVGALVPLIQYVTLLPAIAGIGLGVRGGRQAIVSRMDWSAAAVGCVLCAISVVLTVLDILYSG